MCSNAFAWNLNFKCDESYNFDRSLNKNWNNCSNRMQNLATWINAMFWLLLHAIDSSLSSSYLLTTKRICYLLCRRNCLKFKLLLSLFFSLFWSKIFFNVAKNKTFHAQCTIQFLRRINCIHCLLCCSWISTMLSKKVF